MGTTTNYGWTTPDDTDAVADGALAIRTLAQAIDSELAPTGIAAGSMLYFNGTDLVNLGIGTAGQKLAVNAGATAPEWVAGSATTAEGFEVSATETTTSTTFTDLASAGPSVTVTVGSSGMVEVHISAGLYNDTVGAYAVASFGTSGGATEAASDDWAIYRRVDTAGYDIRMGASRLITGLTVGASVTFTMKYRASAGTASFQRRRILARTW